MQVLHSNKAEPEDANLILQTLAAITMAMQIEAIGDNRNTLEHTVTLNKQRITLTASVETIQ